MEKNVEKSFIKIGLYFQIAYIVLMAITLCGFVICYGLILVLHQMWWVYNLKNYFKLQLLEFLLLGGQSIIGLGCLLFFSFV
ncbi:Uncharacterised protein [Staphylococcus aureus]|nr:Uncharacterised protein [Staphylococcus aureus]